MPRDTGKALILPRNGITLLPTLELKWARKGYIFAADTTRGRFRGAWNGAIAAFRRTLLLDPSYHPAFEHVIDILTTPQVTVCAVVRKCGKSSTCTPW